jgi:hypothetical protein
MYSSNHLRGECNGLDKFLSPSAETYLIWQSGGQEINFPLTASSHPIEWLHRDSDVAGRVIDRVFKDIETGAPFNARTIIVHEVEDI